jgi:hypothetical protein
MSESAEPRPYAPQLRTALILTGSGTAGAYHAGVLRALHEAGVKLDIVAGRGIGAVSALFAAIDGGQSLWSDRGFWRVPGVKQLYPWRPALRVFVWAIALAVLIVAVPLAAAAAGAVVFPIDFVVRIVGLGGVGGLTGEYVRLVEQAFAPDGLPTWLPRLVVLVLGAVGVVVVWDAVASAGRRQQRGSFWWRAAGSPLSSREVVAHSWRSLWDLLRGAAPLRQPPPAELARRYADLLVDNIGQPGFRELLLTVHDLDAHRDLVFALVAEPRRRDLIRRPSTARPRRVVRRCWISRAPAFASCRCGGGVACRADCHGTARNDVCAGRLLAGETHRLCDRPGSLTRILEELSDLGSNRRSSFPHRPTDRTACPDRAPARRKGRLGEYLQSAEAAAVRDATRLVAARTRECPRSPSGRATIPSAHSTSPGVDVRSDRRQPLTELMSLGYEDAYHQFVEPVVGASGERVGVRTEKVERKK